MARIKSLKKEQRLVRQAIRHENKQLKEDCFAGRFQIQQVDRICFADQNGWCNQTYIDENDHNNFGVAGHGYHLWYHANYLIRFIDNEQPERNYEEWFEAYDILHGSFMKENMWSQLNSFIVESDFWDKWDNEEYAKTHWFSGEELNRRIKMNKNWASVEMMKNSDEYNRWRREKKNIE